MHFTVVYRKNEQLDSAKREIELLRMDNERLLGQSNSSSKGPCVSSTSGAKPRGRPSASMKAKDLTASKSKVRYKFLFCYFMFLAFYIKSNDRCFDNITPRSNGLKFD